MTEWQQQQAAYGQERQEQKDQRDAAYARTSEIFAQLESELRERLGVTEEEVDHLVDWAGGGGNLHLSDLFAEHLLMVLRSGAFDSASKDRA